MNELTAEWLPRKFRVNFQIGLSFFAGLAWAIWNTRNKILHQTHDTWQANGGDSPRCILHSEVETVNEEAGAEQDRGIVRGDTGES
jgi:hypothetical protein